MDKNLKIFEVFICLREPQTDNVGRLREPQTDNIGRLREPQTDSVGRLQES